MPKKKIQSAAQATAEATAPPPMSEQELIEKLEAEGQTRLDVKPQGNPAAEATAKKPPQKKPRAAKKPTRATKKATEEKTEAPAPEKKPTEPKKEAPAPQEKQPEGATKKQEAKEQEVTEEPAQQEQPTQEEKAEEVATVRPSKMGQPRKYDEQTKHVSFSLPVSVIENLKIISHLKGTNQTQFILSLIQNEMEKEKDRIEAYKKLIR